MEGLLYLLGIAYIGWGGYLLLSSLPVPDNQKGLAFILFGILLLVLGYLLQRKEERRVKEKIGSEYV